MPLFGRSVNQADRESVMRLQQEIFHGNRMIDRAKNQALPAMASEPEGIASNAFEQKRQETLKVLNDVSARTQEPTFWPVLSDAQGLRLMVDVRRVLEECHRHQLLELHGMGAAAEAFRRGADESPISLDEIRRSQRAFEKSLDKLGGVGAKLARHYKISHQELQRLLQGT